MRAVRCTPSMEVAVTVYECVPAVEVSSVPWGLAAPFESLHEAIPGPSVPSEQPNVVRTFWPRTNVAPLAGEEIATEGGAIAVTRNSTTASAGTFALISPVVVVVSLAHTFRSP